MSSEVYQSMCRGTKSPFNRGDYSLGVGEVVVVVVVSFVTSGVVVVVIVSVFI